MKLYTCSYLNILKPPGSSEGWSIVCTVVGVTVPAEMHGSGNISGSSTRWRGAKVGVELVVMETGCC